MSTKLRLFYIQYSTYTTKEKKGHQSIGCERVVHTLSLPLGRRPLLVLVRQAALHPGDRDGGPDAGPEEGEDPADLRELALEPHCENVKARKVGKKERNKKTYNVRSISLDRKHNGDRHRRAHNRANCPKQR